MSMKIGILEADRLDPVVEAEFGSYGQMSQRLLLAAAPNLGFQRWQVQEGDFPERTDQCDAWLLTGSMANAYDDDPWIIQLMEFIRAIDQAKVKLIGLCFGHQLIARALGGEVARSDKGWGVGVIRTTIHTPQPWMHPARSHLDLLYSHQDQVIKPPPQAVHIAGHGFCPYSGLQVGEHILTLQGHPEFSIEYEQLLLNNRCEVIGERTCQMAMHSLNTPLDNALAAQWLMRFYTG